MTPTLASEGSLADTQLPVLFHTIFVGRRTCVLELQQQGAEKRIFFEDGVPIACSSNLVQETLGRYLVEKGVLEELRSVELLAKSVREGKRLGQVLVEAGVLDQATLHKHLQASLGRRILEAFGLVNARYRLVGLATIPDIALKLNAFQLIYTGVCTKLPAEALRAAFSPPPGQRFALLAQTNELKLNVRDQLIFSALEARPTIDELCVIGGMPEEEVSRRLYAWSVIRLVDYSERVELAPPPAPAVVVEPLPPLLPLPPPSVAPPRGIGFGAKVGVFVAMVAIALFATRAVLRQDPVAPTPVVKAPTVIPAEPRREFRPPPPLPELPALPPSTGRASARAPRNFALSVSGITLAPPKAGKLNPLGKAFFDKGLRALRNDKLDAAADAFARAGSTATNEPEPLYGEALAAFELEKDDASLKAAKAVLERAPAHPMAHLLAGWLEQRAGQIPEARAHYEAYLATPAPKYAAQVQAIVSQLP